MTDKGRHHSNETSIISGIQLGVFSPEEILKMSVAEITEYTLYDSSGEPRIGGLFDPRMGYIEPRKKCKTCEQTYIKCPGHFGHIRLAKPVFNTQFHKEIVKIAKCFCYKCSKLLVNKSHPWVKNIIQFTKGNNKDRMEKMHKLITSKNIKTCGGGSEDVNDLLNNGGCGAIQPKYTNNIKNEWHILAEWRRDTGDGQDIIVEKMYAETMLHIFRRISEDDAFVLGFSPNWCMPHWLIITILPIVPPSVRPFVRQYNNQRSEDDITHIYNDIIKDNATFEERLRSGSMTPDQIQTQTNLLQHHISRTFNNEVKINPAMTRSGRPMKTFSQRLGGKEGRIRNNLMGKRVDFSARSVISPDSNLLIGQLGVPKKIAMNLTFPEIVNRFNINQMYQLVRNGNNVYPGAKSIKVGKTGKTFLLEYQDTSKIVLEYGDIINRHLIDDDIVLFNRQPSLHKMSMMAHFVKVMDGLTFRLNPDTCKPYNADFDGDEMNMHVPQSIQTAVELKYLAAVQRHIISPSTNGPIIQPHQDNLLGLYKLTDDSVYFTQQEMMNLLTLVENFKGQLPEPAIINDKYVRWTGKQLYSLILPPINIIESGFEIINGILRKGQVKKAYSSRIVQIIFNDFGQAEAVRYLNDLQRLTSRYLTRSGFSIGISDLILHPDIKKKNDELLVKSKHDVIELSKKVHLNILEDVGNGLDQIFEAKIQAMTGKYTTVVKEQTLKNVKQDTNRIMFMINSGSKGDATNIQQMMCLLGQQTIDGKRVPLGFFERSLPHYPRYEDSVESRGFITSSFLDGLNPQEFFFHAMSGREGLIDTAVKTANSGYLQRKLVKATEDLKVNHDMTVRSSTNDIIEFCYGEDGFNSHTLEKQKSGFLDISLDKLNNDYYLLPTDKFDDYVMKKELARMKTKTNWKARFETFNEEINKCIESLYEVYSKFVDIRDLDLYYPVNFRRLVINTMEIFKLSDLTKTDMNPLDVLEGIDEILSYCSIGGNDNTTLKLLVYEHFAPKQLLRDKKFNKLAMQHVVNFIKMKFDKSCAEAGEMVGPLAAQSIGEVSTQLTLNTFHFSGIGEKSKVTAGVPRMHELVSNTKTPKTPICWVYLTEKYRHTREMASVIKNNLEMTTIGDILVSDAIYLEPTNEFDEVLEEDREILEIYKIFSEVNAQAQQIPNNPWVIRLEFDRKKIIDQKITMEDVELIMRQNYPDAQLMYMDDNYGKLVFRVRMPFDSHLEGIDDDISHLKAKIKEIKAIVIKGVSRIFGVSGDQEPKAYYVKEGPIYKQKMEYRLETDGSNLFDILTKEGIDTYRTVSHDPNEMFAVFGIEAARFMIEYQLKSVLAVSNAVTSPRHIALLCDKMTRQGDFMAIDRHGINKENIGPLAKSSFEETTDQLRDAALFGACDNIKGVSSNIMVGQVPPCGTGDSHVLLDEDMLLNINEKIEEEDTTDDINEFFQSSEYCSDNADIKFSLKNIESDGLNLEDIPEVGVM